MEAKESTSVMTAQAQEGSFQSTAPFFRVSPVKFLVLSVTTLSLYELYWFYKNWQLIRERERTDVSPAARAIFAFFFCYQVFRRIRAYPAQGARNESLAAGALASGWIVTTLLWKLPDPYWLVCFGAVLFMLPVQLAAERVNNAVAPSSKPNDRFSVIDWVIVAVGGVLFTLAVIGTFVGDK
jgi:hypothetical protein